MQLGLRSGMDGSRLADGDEPRLELERDGGRQDEPSRLDSGDLPGLGMAERRCECGAGTGQELGVGEQSERVRVTVEVAESLDQLVVQVAQRPRRVRRRIPSRRCTARSSSPSFRAAQTNAAATTITGTTIATSSTIPAAVSIAAVFHLDATAERVP
jgi:hypothetical protein